MSARILGSPTMCCVLPPYIVVNNNTTIGGVQHSMATLVLRTKTAYLLPTMTERTLGQHSRETLARSRTDFVGFLADSAPSITPTHAWRLKRPEQNKVLLDSLSRN